MGLRVLLIDDNAERAAAVSAGLKADGCDVVGHVRNPTDLIGLGLIELVRDARADIVVCDVDSPSRDTIEGYPEFPIPTLKDAIRRYEEAAHLTNRAARCVGISINSSSLSDAQWMAYAERLAQELELPVVDPMRGGVDRLAAALTSS